MDAPMVLAHYYAIPTLIEEVRLRGGSFHAWDRARALTYKYQEWELAMKRGILHRSKLEEFKEWLTAQNIHMRPGKGQWQLFQISTPEHGWQVVFDNNNPEHLSMNEKLVPIVEAFIATRADPIIEYATGRLPSRVGVYACRVPDLNTPHLLRDLFLLYIDGQWCYPWSDQRYQGEVKGWIGPLQRRI
jgi:hypothetical protein